MTGHQIGYIRVSTAGQNTARQLDHLELDTVFEDKASAGSRMRPALTEAIQYIRTGDTLHVHSIDRLARNLADLQRIVNEVTAKGAKVVFHKESLTFAGDEDAMSKLMLQMMGAFAEFERSLIRERQAEGIAKAKAQGKRFGRPAVLSEEQIQDIRRRVEEGDEKKALAEEFGVSRQTLYKALSRKDCTDDAIESPQNLNRPPGCGAT